VAAQAASGQVKPRRSASCAQLAAELEENLANQGAADCQSAYAPEGKLMIACRVSSEAEQSPSGQAVRCPGSSGLLLIQHSSIITHHSWAAGSRRHSGVASIVEEMQRVRDPAGLASRPRQTKRSMGTAPSGCRYRARAWRNYL